MKQTRFPLLQRGTGSTFVVTQCRADDAVILVGPPWQAWRAPSWEEIAVAEAKDKAVFPVAP